MKRHFLQSINETLTNISPDLKDYVTELQLLYYVPLSYLIADESLLPSESLRFFQVDNNWTEALTDGALSIGRATKMDGEYDKIQLEHTLTDSCAELHIPRCKKMHIQHRPNALNVFKSCGKIRNELTDNVLTINDVTTDNIITGFIMRSELVRMLKELEVSAYSNKNEIPMLRLDMLTDNIALGLFNGKMTSLVISEPKTGLTFGVPAGENILIPKDVTEENLGKPLRDKSININDYKNEAGRVNVSGLAAELGSSLNAEVDSAKLAFELISVANRAVFESE